MLGVERMTFDAALLVFAFIQVDTWEQAQAIMPGFKAGFDELEAYAASLGGAVEFKYGNYCDGLTQDPLATYGETNIQRMREAAKKYDPTGVFQTRVPGGYKISRINTQSE